MGAIADDTVPSLPRGVRFREDKARDRFILVGPERIFEIDGVAVEILRRVNGKNDMTALVDSLTELFAADAETIRPDVESFLLDLRDKQMVTL